MKLDTSVKELNGVGDKTYKALSSNGICTIKDLLYYLPRAYQNRSDVKDVFDFSCYDEYHSYVMGRRSLYRKYR